MRNAFTRRAMAGGALAVAALGALALAGPAAAHHSFAVFFDGETIVSVTGTVEEFHFRNPHGTINFRSDGSDDHEAGQEWKAETNAPVILRRRGWSPQSLKAGDVITVTGWPARDGTNYLRMQSVTMADGTAVGTAPFTQNDD